MQKRKKDGKLFLSFLMCKNRYKESEVKFFNQPFDEKTFNLEDDVLLKKPKGLVSLSTDFEDAAWTLYRPVSQASDCLGVFYTVPGRTGKIYHNCVYV